MGQPVVHFQIGCKDKSATTEFYTQLFDWQIDSSPAGYITTNPPAGAPPNITGTIASLGHEPHQYVMVYVGVDDIPAYIKRAQELGGALLVPEVPIPTGSFAWIADPGGNIVGLFKAKSE